MRISMRRGYGDAMGIVTAAFNTMEVRTAVTPPLSVDLNAPPDPRTQKMLAWLKPAVILSGPAGSVPLAPYGMPEGISNEALFGGLGLGALLILGGAFMLGRWSA